MPKTILFGGSGFFGPVILAKDQNIISVGRTKPSQDLKNKHINLNSLDDLSALDKIDFDKVIFLIGSSNHHEINLKSTMGIDFNVYPMMKILSYLKDKNIKKFICFTTVLLYDQKKMTLPVSENQSINPYINDYVFSKYLSEQIVKLYEKYVPSIVVRLSNIYGYTKLRRPDLVPTIMQDIFSKERVSIWSDLPKRDFIFTEDAANAVLKLLDVDFTGILNLGTGKMNSIKQISEIIENLSGKKIISENKRVSGPLEFITDISKIKKIVDWSPKYSLEKGLKKTFEIMKNY
jgi:nucleoside-diphosphate-sugar epimerase